MKKVLFLFAASLLSAGAWAQTIVSTQPENRNVFIEEYTGVNCQYCPDGHKIANEVCATYPGHAWAINIHQGGYADGSGYTTQWGDGLAGQYSISGYPCGTTNRCPSMQNRGQWASTAANIRNQVSPVNVAAEATLDPNTRQLTVHVEVYYTGTQNVSSNFLNVVLLQDNVMGPQVGATSWYPEMVENGLYRHMHMLRDMLTGQWGEELTNIAQGTFIEKTYNYTIPAAIGAVPIENFNDLKVLAFVTETHKNILSGNEAEISMLPAVFVAGSGVENSECSLEFQPYVRISNTYDRNVSSVTLQYDGTETTIDHLIPAGSTEVINLPTYTVEVSGDRVQNCRVTKSLLVLSATFEDEDVVNITATPTDLTMAEFNIYTVTSPMRLTAGIDCYGSEASVQLVNQANCQTLWSVGPWTDIPTGNPQYISQIPSARYKFIDFSPATAGLYILRAVDSYGDGWSFTNDNNPSGIWLTDAEGDVISEAWGYSNGPDFSIMDYFLNVTNSGDGSHVGIADAEPVVEFSVYPNPASNYLTISGANGLREVSVIDVTGRTVVTLGATNTIDISSLAAGVYMVRVATEQGVGMQKFVKE